MKKLKGKVVNALSRYLTDSGVPENRGVNVRPNPRTRHEPDTGFFGLGLGLNGFGS